MKRNLDLFRQILFRAEEIDPAEPHLDDLGLDNFDSATVSEHALLMYEAGLIEASFTRAMSGRQDLYSISRILNPGHDLLAAIRSDTVWDRTKQKIGSTVGSATLEIVKGVAEGVAKGMIGLP